MEYFAIFDKHFSTTFQLQWNIENIPAIFLQYSLLCGVFYTGARKRVSQKKIRIYQGGEDGPFRGSYPSDSGSRGSGQVMLLPGSRWGARGRGHPIVVRWENASERVEASTRSETFGFRLKWRILSMLPLDAFFFTRGSWEFFSYPLYTFCSLACTKQWKIRHRENIAKRAIRRRPQSRRV